MAGSDQEITLTNRERLEATGVLQVISYDAGEIVLETQLGLLILRGEGMHITHLDLAAGELMVQGSIGSLEYTEHRGKKLKAKGKNILGRLLK
ncbi:MAG: sporulation protein YabP [Bacillota bacterium]|jgi:sporulation protein YabP|nr:sporulation protein YabP [Bacillota bacterium]